MDDGIDYALIVLAGNQGNIADIVPYNKRSIRSYISKVIRLDCSDIFIILLFDLDAFW